MYQIESSGQAVKARRLLRRGFRVSPTVILLGWTSCLTDISAEMVSSILPVYLMVTLQFSPLQFGTLDGIQQGAAAFVRLLSGFFSDRSRSHKRFAVLGYSLSALCKPVFLVAGSSWSGIAGLIFLDRIGKGVRTSPRDALISLATSRKRLATAFGVHRAFDAAGAMLGPVIAFSLLAYAPRGFDAIFVTSTCFAVAGLAVVALFVRDRRSVGSAADAEPVSVNAVLGLLRFVVFRRLLAVGGMLSLATISDAFVYLTLQQRLHFSAGLFPLLFVITACFYVVLAIPMGRVADRYGRVRTFVGGWVALLIVYTFLQHSSIGWGEALVCLAVLGVYYSATDGVLVAIASNELPQQLRASGLALLATVIGLARLASSLLFGLFWTLWGVDVTVVAFQVMLAAAVFASIAMLDALGRARG